ncbi:hypothetical protein ADUPG1_001341, partial [Aduncisulcus paluster]
MQHLSLNSPKGTPLFLEDSQDVKSSFSLATVLPRRDAYRVNFDTEPVKARHLASIVYGVDYQ